MNRPRPKALVIDTLRISEEQRRQILAELDVNQSEQAVKNRREHERHCFQDPNGMLVVISHPGGNVVKYRVTPRNLSAAGVGFLHGNFLHAGTACLIAVRTRDGKAMLVNGRVVRCCHVQGNVHEIGVQFDAPIEVDEVCRTGAAETASDEASA